MLPDLLNHSSKTWFDKPLRHVGVHPDRVHGDDSGDAVALADPLSHLGEALDDMAAERRPNGQVFESALKILQFGARSFR